MQPAGKYLGEEFHRAGGVPAVVNELMKTKLDPRGRADRQRQDRSARIARAGERTIADVIFPIDAPLKADAGFIVLHGNLFDERDHEDQRDRRRVPQPLPVQRPSDPDAFEGRAIVFDGPEDYHARIDDPKLEIDEHCVLVIRGAGPIGYPGGAEVVNMQPPGRADQARAFTRCRASATAGSRAPPARPRSSTPRRRRRRAAGSRCCAPATGCASTSRSAPPTCSSPTRELERRRAELAEARLSAIPRARRRGRRSSAEWSTSFDEGMVLKPAVNYQRIAQTAGTPRDNH